MLLTEVFTNKETAAWQLSSKFEFYNFRKILGNISVVESFSKALKASHAAKNGHHRGCFPGNFTKSTEHSGWMYLKNKSLLAIELKSQGSRRKRYKKMVLALK